MWVLFRILFISHCEEFTFEHDTGFTNHTWMTQFQLLLLVYVPSLLRILSIKRSLAPFVHNATSCVRYIIAKDVTWTEFQSLSAATDDD